MGKPTLDHIFSDTSRTGLWLQCRVWDKMWSDEGIELLNT
jgi:hypothetical protein